MNSLAIKRVALGIYIAGFSVGVVTHSLDFLRYGLRPYSWGPLPLEIFWSSLVLLDALVVGALLTGRMRIGLVLAAAIMVVDVAVNFYAMTVISMDGFEFPLTVQSIFLGFVLGSIGFLWPAQHG